MDDHQTKQQEAQSDSFLATVQLAVPQPHEYTAQAAQVISHHRPGPAGHQAWLPPWSTATPHQHRGRHGSTQYRAPQPEQHQANPTRLTDQYMRGHAPIAPKHFPLPKRPRLEQARPSSAPPHAKATSKWFEHEPEVITARGLEVQRQIAGWVVYEHGAYQDSKEPHVQFQMEGAIKKHAPEHR
mgnify:CR=1 FL=1